MANKRMIAGDIFEDDFISGLNYFERLLWIGLITSVSDDQGRMMDSPALIRSRVFLFDAAVQDSEVERALRKINTAGKIVRYVAGNKALIQIVNWWKYQAPAWASPSKYPAPTGWTDRAKYHSLGNKVIITNWDNIGGYIAGYVPSVCSAIEDGDVNGDVKSRGEEAHIAPLPPPNIFALYESEIGAITPMIAEDLKLVEKEYPADWVESAIKEAVDHNARNWKYIMAILKRRKAEGGNGNGHKAEPKSEMAILIGPDGKEHVWDRVNGQLVDLGVRK